ncbi:hypothetical protein [Kouleothrix sp.]|uniref:hypothetical protein n=1 Tax=Kouleothrix sp. TaxID=2779161 RepID=UPI00391DC222
MTYWRGQRVELRHPGAAGAAAHARHWAGRAVLHYRRVLLLAAITIGLRNLGL